MHSRIEHSWGWHSGGTGDTVGWALRETLGLAPRLGNSGTLCRWARKGDSGVGHCGETLALGTLWGWAPGSVWGWALRDERGVDRGEEKSSGRGEELSLKSYNPTPRWGTKPLNSPKALRFLKP